jgi:hypothetical protein
MQDNALIYTMQKVHNWFVEQGIPVCDWPLYSPNFNPIKHVWRRLKEIVFKKHPKLTNISSNDNACKVLGKALREAWDALP